MFDFKGMSYYYTRDHLGSTRELCDSSGNIKTRYSYDLYGRVLGSPYVSGTHDAFKQYAGMEMHLTSELYLTKYRAYDSSTGRWLSKDPIGEVGGVNLYGYVDNNPGNFIDSLGLVPCKQERENLRRMQQTRDEVEKAIQDKSKLYEEARQIISIDTKSRPSLNQSLKALQRNLLTLHQLRIGLE